MRTFLPILATLALTAGLYAPVVRSMLARRAVGNLADTTRVNTDRVSPRPATQGPADGLPAERTQDFVREAAEVGLPGSVDPVLISLGSGWWLTPPGVLSGPSSVRSATARTRMDCAPAKVAGILALSHVLRA